MFLIISVTSPNLPGYLTKVQRQKDKRVLLMSIYFGEIYNV